MGNSFSKNIASLDSMIVSTAISGTLEFIISHEHENFIPIEQIEEPYVQNPEEDDTIATRKSKRQRTAKSFGDDYIVYLVDNTPTTIEEAYSSPDADL